LSLEQEKGSNESGSKLSQSRKIEVLTKGLTDIAKGASMFFVAFSLEQDCFSEPPLIYVQLA